MKISRMAAKLVWRAVRTISAYRDAREPIAKWFPTCFRRNYIYEPLFPSADGGGYFSKYHAAKPGNPLTVNFKRHTLDILRGRRVAAGTTHRVELARPSALAYAVQPEDITRQEDDYAVTVKMDGREHVLGGLVGDRFYYLPVREPGSVEFVCDHDLVVAEPIDLKQQRRHRTRLCMVIFIDNFGWDVMDRLDLARDLPNIARFFASGARFDNCYSSSNWTLPGVCSIVSGNSLNRHGMFHFGRDDIFLGDGYKPMAEFFQDDGYLTFQVCGNARKSPAYNYVRGFDRTLYRHDLPLSEVIDALKDHLRAFPERDHFVWATIFDAHHMLTGVPDVAGQLAVPIEGHSYASQNEKSPMRLAADEGQTLRYIQMLRRIDGYLGELFAFLAERYADDEMVVALVADHGPGFMTADGHALSHEKTHVPFLLRSPGIAAGAVTEFIQVTDILPSLLYAADLPIPADMDGQLPRALGGATARDWALGEIKYPGKPYEATIKDDQFEFYLRSEGRVRDDGGFELGRYTVELFRRRDWTEELSARYPDVAARFTAAVLRHIGR